MSYTVTVSGTTFTVGMSSVDYAVTLSQVGQQGAAGPTGISWLGAWALSTDFAPRDVVSNNGSSYICIQAHTSSITDEPGVGANTATYWEVLAEKGVDGSGIGTVTSIDVAGGTGLTSSGGPITTSGTITVALDAASQDSLALADSALQSSDIGVSVQGYSAILAATTASFTTADETKLDGIETGATADQTGAEIKTAYESEADTNAYTDAEKVKVGHLTVTQGVDLDAIETRVNSLDAAVVLMGAWDASAGVFPGGGVAQAGESWIVSVGGTVGGVAFVANDRIIALTDNASATVYAANWHKLDYTDAVLSVAGKVGAVTLAKTDIADFDEADYATAAQGALADSAVQPGDNAATLGSGTATDGYVLTSDGAGGAAWEVASGGGATNTQTFTASGTWTKPANVTFVRVELVGGGGGGANNTSSGNACGGGGGGYASKIFLASDLSATASVIVGAGGAGAASGSSGDGAKGGTSVFSGVNAYGGQGGSLTRGGHAFAVVASDSIQNTFAGLGGASSGNAAESGQAHALGGGGGKYAGGDSLYGGAGGGGAVGSVDFSKGFSRAGPGGDGGEAQATAGVKAQDGANYGGGGGGSCNDGGGGDGAGGVCRVISW